MKASTFVLTLHSCLFVSLLLLGCNSDMGPADNVVQEKELSREELVINSAVSNQDYRLYGLTGRRTVIPGFESENFSQIKERCGVKLLSGTGDVLKTNKDRVERRENYQFAFKINKRLYALCLDNTDK